MSALIYDYSHGVCSIELDVLYRVINTDEFPLLVNPDGLFNLHILVTFAPDFLEIMKDGEFYNFKYSFAEGVEAHTVSKKIVESLGFPQTVLRSSSGLRF